MIRTDKQKPSPDNPDKKVYDGQRTAQAVFNDLEAHLTSIGYLPEDYFLFDDRRWGKGREFPSDGYLTNQVDYGGSEGIYLDITLEYQENGERKWEHFATGKTLGESGNDLDRMNLIASAVTKAFHADGVHARYVMVGGSPAPEGATIHLNLEEKDIMTFCLTHFREALETNDPEYIMAGQILNRIKGKPAGEQTEKRVPTQGIIFSRVQLHAENGAESNFFYVPGIPESYADIEEYEDYIELVDIHEGDPGTDCKTITATVTPFSIGSGAPRDANQEDIDRIYKLADDLENPEYDMQIAFGWFQGEDSEFNFRYDDDEQIDQGMGGIE
ncbi:MAG: hypothetical protein FWF05_04365 [Oscillospiraceae bacterium]|nr:hypothetical protein [Oscillospiraceae bacterium]